jgi:hypothetical protein
LRGQRKFEKDDSVKGYHRSLDGGHRACSGRL